MKARSEAQRANELKRGPGGIRDVEFAVQLLQLVHGRHDNGVRSPNTLEALDQLSRGGYLDAADAEHLATAYRYLRRVEHLLQLRDEQQVYALPEPVPQRTRLARVLGYRDRPDASALEQFEATHRRHLASVRDIHERLFFRPLLEAMAGRGPLPRRGPRRAAGRVRLPGLGRHPGRHRRAHRRDGPHRPPVPEPHAPAARVALGHARPRPRPAAAAHGRRRPGAGRRGRGGAAGLRRGRAAVVPAARLVEGGRTGPAPPSRGTGRPGRPRSCWPSRRPAPAWSRRLGRRWAGGPRRRSAGGTAYGASCGGRSCGSPAATCWTWPTPARWAAS